MSCRTRKDGEDTSVCECCKVQDVGMTDPTGESSGSNHGLLGHVKSEGTYSGPFESPVTAVGSGETDSYEPHVNLGAVNHGNLNNG
jgi:hypothetical protein